MGSGPLEDDLKSLAEDMGIAGRVRFTGHVPGGRRYFKAFDVFALTSPNEGFGMVLIEAMAAGVPLISSDSGAGGEILKGIGKTFTAGGVEEVALRLIEVSKLSSEEKRKTSEAAMASLEKRFSYPAAQKKFQRLFAEFAY